MNRKPHPSDVSDDEWAFADQGYAGEQPAADALKHGIRLEVVELSTAKRGLVLLPHRWVVEGSFGWMARFRRLARDCERLAETLVGLHFAACYADGAPLHHLHDPKCITGSRACAKRAAPLDMARRIC